VLNGASDLHFGAQTGYFKGDFVLVFLISSRHARGYYFKTGQDIFFLQTIYKYHLKEILQTPIPLIGHKPLEWLNSPLCVNLTYPYYLRYGVQILNLHNSFFQTSQLYLSLGILSVCTVQLKFLDHTKTTNN
jgi:hypothetical protein